MKTSILFSLLSLLITAFTPVAQAADNSSSFEVQYDDGLIMNYQGCGRCVAYPATGEPTVSVVIYDKSSVTYWALTITQNYDGSREVRLSFVDRNQNIPARLRGSYEPIADVTSKFELTAFELKSGGRVAGKLHPVKVKAFGREVTAVFAGSFDIKLP